MLAGQDEEQAKPERIVLSPEEYPGTPPCSATVAEARRFRQKGNTAYGESRYEDAVRFYSKAVLLNPADHLSFSNRSACWLCLSCPIEALDDAEFCLKLVPAFAKGYMRKGVAEQLLGRRVDAQDSFKRGLRHDPASGALQTCLRDLRAEPNGGLQSTLYHVLFVSPHLQMDRLFQVLEDPDSLTASYVDERRAELDAQFECLTQTLRVDVSLLLSSPVLRDAYDRVTFACGQLVQWAPEAASRHLTQARRIVEGLGLALRCGWRIHHGVAKFSANALTILATSDGAHDDLRRLAVRLLLGGMLRWLLDPAPEPEEPPEDRDVCGCTFLAPRLSAATWLERLFEHGTRSWVREECEKFPDIILLAIHLCIVVRDERAAPLGFPCLLRLPGVAAAAMGSEMVVDLSTCSRLAAKRHGRQWLNRQRGKPSLGSGAASPGEGVGATAQVPGPSTPRFGEAEGGEAPPSIKSQGGAHPMEVESAQPADGGAQPMEVDNTDSKQAARLPAPSQRLGEWMMASLGYLLIFIDDDALFAAHACSALHRLALAAPDGVTRLAMGMWMGLPMLERLSALACQHTAALELLETLARHSSPARTAMCSLAGALAGHGASVTGSGQYIMEGRPQERRTDLPLQSSSNDNEQPQAKGLTEAKLAAGRDTEPSAAARSASLLRVGLAAGAPSSSRDDTAKADDVRAGGGNEEESPEGEHDHEGFGEPSWVECFHELRDELWADVQAPVPEVASTAEATAAAAAEFDGLPVAPERAPAASDRASDVIAADSGSEDSFPLPERGDVPVAMTADPPSLVLLGNFDEAAPQVPVAALLDVWAEGPSEEAAAAAAAALPHRTDIRNLPTDTGRPLRLPAVPAVWNSRFQDEVSAPVAEDVATELGTPGWLLGKQATVVLLLRSAIQRSPATPDWASAVWLSAEAGARAAVVVNDLPDDGPSQPAFKMGLFGSPAPPIPAFMVCGRDGEALRKIASTPGSAPLHITARSTRLHGGMRPWRQSSPSTYAPSSPAAASSAAASPTSPIAGGQPLRDSGGGGAVPDPSMLPAWPLVLRVPHDVAQAWSLFETVHRAASSPDLAADLDVLASRMGLPEKRVWLTRRLQRNHRGDTDADEPVELQLAFVECDRDGEQLQQLRKQLVDKTGIVAHDITGEFEVRFREESSVGSAVMREWMDLIAQQAFLLPSRRLLVSFDNGATFFPDRAATFLNPHWQGDFELLGRLLGLALWHQVTLDLPLHPYVCDLLLRDGDWPEPDFEEDAEQLSRIDPELHRHKVQWLLANDVSALGYDMPFTDDLLGGGSGAAVSPQASAADSPAVAHAVPSASSPPLDMQPLPAVVSVDHSLPGTELAAEPTRLRQASQSELALVPGGEDKIVTEENKAEFVASLMEWRLRGSFRGPVQAMLRGLRAAVPSPVLAEARRMLSPAEVHALLAGSRDIDAHDWERNTRLVGGLTPKTQEVEWFWKVVHEWASDGRQDRLQDLLQFATGSRRVPVGGFAQLVGFNGGKHLFTLAKGAHLTPESLPTSHACICTVDLPPWESQEAARRKLLAAAEAGRARFDEGTAARAAAPGPTSTPDRPALVEE